MCSSLENQKGLPDGYSWKMTIEVSILMILPDSRFSLNLDRPQLILGLEEGALGPACPFPFEQKEEKERVGADAITQWTSTAATHPPPHFLFKPP